MDLQVIGESFNKNVTIEQLVAELPKIVLQMAYDGYPAQTVTLAWFDLDPKYNVLMQSFTELNNYIGYTKGPALPAEVASPVLVEANFDALLGPNLVCQEIKGKNKVLNRGVENLTTTYAQFAQLSLDFLDYDETMLIEICYRARYYFLVGFLNDALQISQKINERRLAQGLESSDHNPLFDFVFSNQFVLNCFSVQLPSQKKLDVSQASKDFVRLLSNPALIYLITLDVLDIEELFHEVTWVDKGYRKFYDKNLNQIIKNEKVIEAFLEHWDKTGTLPHAPDSGSFLELLTSSTAEKLFDIPLIKRLFFYGAMDFKDLLAIKSEQLLRLESLKLLENVEIMPVEQMRYYWATCTTISSPVSVADVDDSSLGQSSVYQSLLNLNLFSDSHHLQSDTCQSDLKNTVEEMSYAIKK